MNSHPLCGAGLWKRIPKKPQDENGNRTRRGQSICRRLSCQMAALMMNAE
jgi:hypothetical protein